MDSETGVLKNLAGIRDAALLEEYEGELSIIRQYELSEVPLSATYDLAHLRAIHRHFSKTFMRGLENSAPWTWPKATAASARTFTSEII